MDIEVIGVDVLDNAVEVDLGYAVDGDVPLLPVHPLRELILER